MGKWLNGQMVKWGAHTVRVHGRRLSAPCGDSSLTCFVEKGEFTVIPTTIGRRDLAGNFDEFRIFG